MLDPTHPGAQEYLRKTYEIIAREWGIRFIKLDFMDSTAIIEDSSTSPIPRRSRRSESASKSSGKRLATMRCSQRIAAPC